MLIDAEGLGTPEAYSYHEYTISCIKADAKDNFLITGDVKGNVIIWRLVSNHNSYKLTVYESFKDQQAQISSIFFSYELKCFAISSLDGSVIVYNIITSKKIRAYYHPNGLPINDVIIVLKF
jgi:WD40 repeat protein